MTSRRHAKRMFYQLEVPGKWWTGKQWIPISEDSPTGRASSCRDFKTANKAFKALNNALPGSILFRLIPCKGVGYYVDEYKK